MVDDIKIYENRQTIPAQIISVSDSFIMKAELEIFFLFIKPGPGPNKIFSNIIIEKNQ